MAGGELTHVVVTTGGVRRLVERDGFAKEAELQDLVTSAPELLAPLGEGLRFAPIGWEVPLGGGRLDVLFIDSEGVLTLVETKLKANDESRREVIGQVLEYAMFASQWTLADLRATATAFLQSDHAPDDVRGSSLEEALAASFRWTDEEEDGDEGPSRMELFLAQVQSNLEKGHLRIVCGVDEQIENLERLVVYFSAHSDLQVVLLQVTRFPVEAGANVLIPTLHGDIQASPGRRVTDARVRTPDLTYDDLIALFPEGPQRQAVVDLIDAARSAGAVLDYGPNGASVRVRTAVQRAPVSIAWIFGPGRWGWQRARDISFGCGIFVHPSLDPNLAAFMTEYVNDLAARQIGEDVTSKGVVARALTAEQAVPRLDELKAILVDVIQRLAALQPAPSGDAS